jgi:hypothetical protein
VSEKAIRRRMQGMKLLWLVLPDNFVILVIAVIALGLIVGLVKPKAAFAFIGTLLLSIVLSPFVEAIFAALPSWVSVLALIVFVAAIARAAFEMVLGKGATDHMVGGLALDLIRGAFHILLLPFRIVGWVLFRGSTR